MPEFEVESVNQPIEEPEESATPTPQTTTLAEVLGLVTCTPSQGIHYLNSMLEANADRDPSFASALNAAITQLQGMPAE